MSPRRPPRPLPPLHPPPSTPRLSRRVLLGGLAATSAALWAGLGGGGGGGRLALADAATDRRLVVLLLRGGLDGLSWVPPVGDTDLAGIRGRFLEEGAPPLPLTADFGLHPALGTVAGWSGAGEVLALHAVGLPPGGARSHFEAQDMLEGGGLTPRQERTGWLARALAALPPRADAAAAVALGAGLPLVLRGDVAATTLDPGLRLDGGAEDDAMHLRLEALYAADPALLDAWRQAQQTRSLLEDLGEATDADAGMEGMRRPGGRGAEGQRAAALALGQILAAAGGPRVAVAELGGWDTHTGQQGALQTRLRSLDAALAGLRTGLGAAWSQSAVLLVTEFGRTVVPNGTGGTDHGSAGAALLVGGAVQGGARADWPGLKAAHRLDGRDLRPTTDVRALFKGLLRDHLGVPEQALDTTVFPQSAALSPLDGLVRT